MDKTLFSYTRQFLSGTLLSRLSGFFRDVSMAFAFGDIAEVASLILAYRLCMLLRRILGEGSMQSAFIPGYQTIKEKDNVQALAFFKHILWRWLVGVSGLCLVLGLLFFYLKPFFNSEWSQVIDLVVRLLPSLICIIGYTIFQAFLQCHGKYFTASLAPTVSNLSWGIGCILLRGLDPFIAMQKASIFICVGLLLQWLVLFPETNKLLPKGFFKNIPKKIDTSSYGFNFFQAVALAAIGISATQINSALDGIFAKFADPKGPIHLWFSIRIQQLPLALLSIGLISAASPKLCQLIATDKKEEAKELCSSVASKLSIMMMFITCGIICVGDQIIRLLFQHGLFSESATFQTHFCLIAYMIGLVPTSLATIYASFFYAMKDYKKPSIASVYCLIANLILNALMVFVFHWGSWSVAASTSLCSFFNAYLLKRSLATHDLFTARPVYKTLCPYISALMAMSFMFILKPFIPVLNPLAHLSVLSLCYLTLYALICKIMRYNDPFELVSAFIPVKSQPVA